MLPLRLAALIANFLGLANQEKQNPERTRSGLAGGDESV